MIGTYGIFAFLRPPSSSFVLRSTILISAARYQNNGAPTNTPEAELLEYL
jgi:hypothetical protein